MGQYYIIANVDKKQYLKPCDFDCGDKLIEFIYSDSNMFPALCLLLADGNGRGGGDFRTLKEDTDSLIGSWAGDRIVIAGDYADKGKFVDDKDKNVYKLAVDKYENISKKILKLLDSSC